MSLKKHAAEQRRIRQSLPKQTTEQAHAQAKRIQDSLRSMCCDVSIHVDRVRNVYVCEKCNQPTEPR